MKRIAFVLLAAFLVTSIAPASSEKGKVGIGIVVGAPTGLSMKFWQNQRVAFQGVIGGMYKGGLMLGADYLVHERALKDPNMPFYYGAGVFMGDSGFGGPDVGRGSVAFGVRGVFGVDYLVPDHPFDVAIELGPALLLSPQLGMGIELSVAFRFYP
jgi:hypothetical protein